MVGWSDEDWFMHRSLVPTFCFVRVSVQSLISQEEGKEEERGKSLRRGKVQSNYIKEKFGVIE